MSASTSAQPGDGDREAGLGGGLPDDGVVRVLAVVDRAAGQRPDAGGAGARRCADEQHVGRLDQHRLRMPRSGAAAPARWSRARILPGSCYRRGKDVGFLTLRWPAQGCDQGRRIRVGHRGRGPTASGAAPWRHDHRTHLHRPTPRTSSSAGPPTDRMVAGVCQRRRPLLRRRPHAWSGWSSRSSTLVTGGRRAARVPDHVVPDARGAGRRARLAAPGGRRAGSRPGRTRTGDRSRSARAGHGRSPAQTPPAG